MCGGPLRLSVHLCAQDPAHMRLRVLGTPCMCPPLQDGAAGMGAAVLKRFRPVLLLCAVFLLFSAYKMLRMDARLAPCLRFTSPH